MARKLPPELAARWTSTNADGVYVANVLPHAYLLDCDNGARFWTVLRPGAIVMSCRMPKSWAFYTQQPKDWFRPTRPSKLFGFSERMDPVWQLLGASAGTSEVLEPLLVCFEAEGMGLRSGDHAAARFVRAAPADYERWLATQSGTSPLPSAIEARWASLASLHGQKNMASTPHPGEFASATDRAIVIREEGAEYMPGNHVALQPSITALPSPP